MLVPHLCAKRSITLILTILKDTVHDDIHTTVFWTSNDEDRVLTQTLIAVSSTVGIECFSIKSDSLIYYVNVGNFFKTLSSGIFQCVVNTVYLFDKKSRSSHWNYNSVFDCQIRRIYYLIYISRYIYIICIEVSSMIFALLS